MLENLEEIIAAVLVVAICLIVGLEVVLRYVLTQPLSWTEELSTIFFVWITMLGSSIALKHSEHFAVELFRPRLRGPSHRRLQGVTLTLVLAFCVFIVWYGTLFTLRNRGVHTPAMEWSRAIPYAAIPVGGLFMFVRTLQKFVRLRRPPEVAE